MMVGQGIDLENMGQVDRQTLEAVDTQAGLDELRRWLWKGQFPSIEFNDNFPTTGNAEIENVIRISNNIANRLRKLGIVGDPPEDGVGIEYGSHGLVKIGRIKKPFEDIIGQGIVEIVRNNEFAFILTRTSGGALG
jgi:hypothetical protein